MKRKLSMIAVAVLPIIMMLFGMTGCSFAGKGTGSGSSQTYMQFIMGSTGSVSNGKKDWSSIIFLILLFVGAAAFAGILTVLAISAKKRKCLKRARKSLKLIADNWNNKDSTVTLAELIHDLIPEKEIDFGISDLSKWQITTIDVCDTFEIFYRSKLVEEKELTAKGLHMLSKEDLEALKDVEYIGILKVRNGVFLLKNISFVKETPDSWNPFPKEYNDDFIIIEEKEVFHK